MRHLRAVQIKGGSAPELSRPMILPPLPDLARSAALPMWCGITTRRSSRACGGSGCWGRGAVSICRRSSRFPAARLGPAPCSWYSSCEEDAGDLGPGIWWGLPWPRQDGACRGPARRMPAATGSQARRTRFGVVRLEEGDVDLEMIAGNGDGRGGRVEGKGSWEELM
jgi:hypothetical protein